MDRLASRRRPGRRRALGPGRRPARAFRQIGSGLAMEILAAQTQVPGDPGICPPGRPRRAHTAAELMVPAGG